MKYPRHLSSSLRPLLSLAVTCSLLPSCGGGNPSAEFKQSAGGGDPTQAKPSDSSQAIPTYFLVDPHSGGLASEVELVRMYAGRLVDVYDVVQSPEGEVRRLLFEDMVVGEDLVSDGERYELVTNPVTQAVALTILAENDLSDPGDAFDRLLDSAERLTRPVSNRGPEDLTPLPLLPRNGALVLQFDDALDHATVNKFTVEVLVGSDLETPFEARIFPDPSHGALLRTSGGEQRFHSTRVVVDFSISLLEAQTASTPLTPNATGLPASTLENQANVALRLPTSLDVSGAVFSRLENVSGHGLGTGSENEPVDRSRASQPLVRTMRAGRDGDSGAGFLRDQQAPQIVAEQAIDLLIAEPDTRSGARESFDFVVDLRFESVACASVAEAGDLLQLAGGVFQVYAQGSAPVGGRIDGVGVRSLGTEGSAARDLVGPGTHVSAFDPDVDRAQCFVRFLPEASGVTTNIEPDVQVRLRFSEPMDLSTITAFDSMMLVTETESPLPTEVVACTVAAASDLLSFTLIPTLPLRHAQGFSEEYYFTMGAALGLARDLGGNALEDRLSDVPFRLRHAADSAASGSWVLRFGDRDEDRNDDRDPITGAPTLRRPEVRGQFLYDLDRGVVRARPVTRFRAVADRNQPVTSLMNSFPGGIQTPLTPLGSRMMHVWRYADFGFDLGEETLYNIDVEGLSWAPANATVISDQYEEFRIRLAHSNRLPDEALTAFNLPAHPFSGLEPKPFESIGQQGNLLNDPLGQLTVVHEREKGYVVDPIDRYTSASGTTLMPYPMNRDPDASERTFYTWRDTAVLAKGAPNGAGADMQVLAAAGVIGTDEVGTYPPKEVPSVALPLLMEYSCYPSNTGVGLNSFDISVPVNSAPTPYFRLFSTGGIDSTGARITKNPDLQSKATGGFDGITGDKLPGFDNTFYHGAIDVVVRVSRFVTIWTDGGFPDEAKDWSVPNLEPRSELQPSGTEVRLAYRGASAVEFEPETTGESNRFDASTYDAYGEPIPKSKWSAEYWPDPQGHAWSESIDDLDGSRYLQVRVTLIGNPSSHATPELSAIAVPFVLLQPD